MTEGFKPNDFGRGLEQRLGAFPFFDFWGPKSGLASSRWLADAAIDTLERERPALTMVYLPHLDYDHQRLGPQHPRSLQAINEVDALCADLIAAADRVGAAVVVVSEYSIEEVSRPVHINRVLREAGLLEVRQTPAGGAVPIATATSTRPLLSPRRSWSTKRLPSPARAT